jgi:hypothetical protein
VIPHVGGWFSAQNKKRKRRFKINLNPPQRKETLAFAVRTSFGIIIYSD